MFGDLHERRLLGGGHPHRQGSSVRSIRATTMRCSSRSLALCSSRSPRWSSTAGSALRRVEPASATVLSARALAAHQQLRAGADEGDVGRADAVAEAARVSRRAARRRPAPGRTAARRVTRTSRASTTFSSSPARIRSRRARHRLLVVLGRQHARDRVRRRPGRDRAAASASARSEASRARAARRRSSGVVARRHDDVDGRRAPRRRARGERDLRQHQQRRRQATPTRARAPPSAANAKPPTQTGPAAGAASRVVAGDRVAHAARRALARGRARSDPAPRASTVHARARARRARNRRGRAAPSTK